MEPEFCRVGQAFISRTPCSSHYPGREKSGPTCFSHQLNQHRPETCTTFLTPPCSSNALSPCLG
jgi:hypothetical protein